MQQKIQLDEETKQILSLCSVHTKMTASTFFPERFYRPFSSISNNIFNFIDNSSNYVAIAAPRGFGKTSSVALALPARHIMFKLTPFIVYINKSFEAACLQSDNLRRELVTNRNIKSAFGPIRPKRVETEFEEVFSKKSWVAYDTLFFPRGAGQQVRGILYKNYRPGLIIIDDLEDPNQIENEEYRNKLKIWFDSEVVPAVSQDDMNWKIIYIDTLKHEDSLLQSLLDDPSWQSVRLEACDDSFKATDTSYKDDSEIKRLWEYYEKRGQTDVFFREYRNLPISTKDASFQQKYFTYYNCLHMPKKSERDLDLSDAEIQKDKNIENVILVDPAKTVKLHSAESAIINIGLNLREQKYFVRDIVSEKFYPDELYNSIFSMAERSNSRTLGIEITSLCEFIQQPIKNEMVKRGKVYDLIWLNARGGTKKELRIKELVPYYRQGYIYHNAALEATKRLEAQLLVFPRSKLWDIMDCLAYLIELLELGGKYFDSLGPNDNEEELEKMYAELERLDDPALDYERLIA